MTKRNAVASLFLLTFVAFAIHAEDLTLEQAIGQSVKNLSGKLPKGALVAVMDTQAETPALSDFITDEIIAALVNGNHLTVVDRQDLDLAQKELNFQLSGEVSDESALSIGKKLGAQSIVTGSVTNLGPVYRFRLKTIDVQTSAIQDLYTINVTDLSLLAFLTNSNPASAIPGKPAKKTPAKPGNFEVIPGSNLPAPIDMDRFKAATLAALEYLGYSVVESDGRGYVIARLSKTSWWVTIKVCYWADEYWFEYLDSNNLDADPAADRIHRNYRRWIPNLDKYIAVNYDK